MEPRIVLARRRGEGSWEPTEIRSAGRAVSPETARKTLDMMQTVVSPTGTGRLAGLAGVAVAGKTGTAQKLDVALRQYSRDKYIAWFIGVVPADDPELAIVVAVDEPKGWIHTGGMVAAPLFARVAAAQLAHRGIVTEPEPIAPPPPPTLVASADPSAPPAAPGAALPPVSTGPESRPIDPAAQEQASAPPTSNDSTELPPQAAIAAPPARPAADPAAGPRPSPVLARVHADAGPAFVPDFLGQTIAHAQRLAESEALEISTLGAIEGRVVSQLPVAGTVLEGANRTVQLRFATGREEG
jgi:membrane peptidoglycan carboxypeptidase